MSEIIKTAGILLIQGGEVLLVKHTEKAKHKTGIYGIPAGRVEPGETEIETAIRETYQETGLLIEKKYLKQLPNIYTATIQRKNELDRTFSLKVFLCRSFEGEPTVTEEAVPEWVRIGSLDSYNLLPNITKVVKDGLLLLN